MHPRRLSFALGVILGLLVAPNVRAQWNPDGAIVCSAPGGQQFVALVSDGSGGAIAAWEDTRNFAASSIDIYAQHILGNGVIDPAWPTQGLPVCTALSRQMRPVLAADAQGGAFVVWNDYRSTSTFPSGPLIYAQHITASGTIGSGWPADGIPGSSLAAYSLQRFDVVADGNGGAYVGFAGLSFSGIAVQRLDPGGIASGWPSDGVAIVQPLQPLDAKVAGDGAGGCFVTWRGCGAQGCGEYVQRLTSAGAPEPGWPAGGQLVILDRGTLSGPRAMFAVASGAVLVAADGFNESQFIVDQRVSATGTAQWDSAGVELASSPIVDDVHFATDAEGGAFVAWEEGDNGLTSASTWNIRVFRQGPDGAPASGWSTAIFPSDTSGSQTMPRIVEDGTGGILLAWRQWPIGARFSHVFAHHLDASGNSAPGWPSTGIAVAPTDSGQGTPAMISDGSGGLIAAFADGRNQAVSGSDIYAQRLLGNGAVASVDHRPATATGFRVDPNPTSGALRLSFALSRAGPVDVELFDIGGKRIGLRELGWLSAGPHAIRWDAPTSQAPGVYWLRLHRDGLANSQRIAILR